VPDTARRGKWAIFHHPLGLELVVVVTFAVCYDNSKQIDSGSSINSIIVSDFLLLNPAYNYINFGRRRGIGTSCVFMKEG